MKCDSINFDSNCVTGQIIPRRVLVKREMLILFLVNCERTNLFSTKRDLDPPPPTPFSLSRNKKKINQKTIQ